MKKLLVLAFVLLVIPLSVNAAEVTKVTGTANGGKISFTGTIDENVTAVMCKLYSSEGDELDLLSTEVNEKKFEGSFTVVKNDTYTVYCAKYEGGEIKSDTVKVTGAETSVNPKTVDNIVTYVSLAVVSLAAIVLLGYKIIKSKKN